MEAAPDDEATDGGGCGPQDGVLGAEMTLLLPGGPPCWSIMFMRALNSSDEAAIVRLPPWRAVEEDAPNVGPRSEVQRRTF